MVSGKMGSIERERRNVGGGGELDQNFGMNEEA